MASSKNKIMPSYMTRKISGLPIFKTISKAETITGGTDIIGLIIIEKRRIRNAEKKSESDKS